MQIDLATLPDNPAILQQMLRDVVAVAAQEQVALQGAVQEREANILRRFKVTPISPLPISLSAGVVGRG